MADIPPLRQNIPLPGAQFRAAVSENLIQALGGSINFINDFQHSEKKFYLNGPYGSVLTPQLGVDGLVVFEFDAEIIDVWMFNIVAGTSGTTELDLKLATTPGGSFASIFNVTPKIDSTAASNVWVKLAAGGYVPPTGCTPGQLISPNVDAGSALRLDLLQSMPDAQNCGIIVHYRPR